MTNRLTNPIRDHLCKALLEDAFSARIDVLISREKELAIAVRDHAAGKHLPALLKLPDDLRNMDTAVKVQLEGERVYTHLHFEPTLRSWAHPAWCGQDSAHMNFDCSVRLPCPESVVLLSVASRLGRKVNAYLSDQNKLAREIVECKRLTERTLASFSSVKKLLEHWPAVEPLLPANEVMQLPAVPVQDLIDRLSAAKEAA